MRKPSLHGAAAVGAVTPQLESSEFKSSEGPGAFFMECDDTGKCLNRIGCVI